MWHRGLLSGLSVFLVFVCFLFPFPYRFFQFYSDWVLSFWNAVLGLFLPDADNLSIYSDSSALGFVMLIVLGFSFGLVLVLIWMRKESTLLWIHEKVSYQILTYFLALILLIYGFDKIFKTQFYLPEPNIMYTPFGLLDRDILYWSTIGTSYSYNVFLGFCEVVPALLILFRRTRVLGLILSMLVLIHVMAVNFGFQIHVKGLIAILISINVFLLMPYLVPVYRFFILHQQVRLVKVKEKGQPRPFISFFKTLVIGFIFLEVLYPYVLQGNFQDDLMKRPPFHGAYAIRQPNSTWKRVFIHRRDYVIFQDNQEHFYPIRVRLNYLDNTFICDDNDLKIKTFSLMHTHSLELYYTDQSKVLLPIQKLPYWNLPVLH